MPVAIRRAWILVIAGIAGLGGCAQFGSTNFPGLGDPATPSEPAIVQTQAASAPGPASPPTNTLAQAAPRTATHEAARPNSWNLLDVLAPTRTPPITNEEAPTARSEFSTAPDVQLSPAAVPTKDELLAKLKNRSDVETGEYDRWEKIVQSTPENDWPLVAIQLQAVLNYKSFQAAQEAENKSPGAGDKNQVTPVSATAEIAPPAPAPAAPPAPAAEPAPAPEAAPEPKKEEPKAEPQPAEAPAAKPEPAAASSPPAESSPAAAAPAPPADAAPAELPPPASDAQPPQPIPTEASSEAKAATPAPGNWRDHLDLAIATLEADLRETAEAVTPAGATASAPAEDAQRAPPQRQPDRARKEAYLRLLYLAAQRPADAARGIEAFPSPEQEFWKHQVHGLGVFLDEQGAPVPDRRARLALRELNQGLHHLAVASGLDVRNLAFCTQVFSFGNYVEFSPYEFRPNQEVLLYAEIENFAAESRPDGFETEMQGSYQIFDATGQRVAEHVFPAEKELCRNRRRDYFVPFRLYLPKRIAPGPYTLQLTVEDLKGRRFGQASIRFTMVP